MNNEIIILRKFTKQHIFSSVIGDPLPLKGWHSSDSEELHLLYVHHCRDEIDSIHSCYFVLAILQTFDQCWAGHIYIPMQFASNWLLFFRRLCLIFDSNVYGILQLKLSRAYTWLNGSSETDAKRNRWYLVVQCVVPWKSSCESWEMFALSNIVPVN